MLFPELSTSPSGSLYNISYIACPASVRGSMIICPWVEISKIPVHPVRFADSVFLYKRIYTIRHVTLQAIIFVHMYPDSCIYTSQSKKIENLSIFNFKRSNGHHYVCKRMSLIFQVQCLNQIRMHTSLYDNYQWIVCSFIWLSLNFFTPRCSLMTFWIMLLHNNYGFYKSKTGHCCKIAFINYMK